MSDTPKLEMPEIAQSQASKYITHNEALRILDGVVQCNVLDKDLIVPPGSPTDGDAYIVGMDTDSTSGDWEGHDDEIAYYKSSGWVFFTPADGWRAYVQDEARGYMYESSIAPSGESAWRMDSSSGVREVEADADLRCAIIDIGDWNMDSDTTKHVYSATVAIEDIRAVDVLIRRDSDAASFAVRPLLEAGGFNVLDDGSTVDYSLYRDAAGVFDNTDHDETSYNRGWIRVWYEAT